ncbi:MAG: 3-phosphoshikimate 1-carboxyvinyltransferase [Clostridia bacterium]|nr:3-phosphoshikimate 1-carboxyvinyltransferase [Clostridia bacterium]
MKAIIEKSRAEGKAFAPPSKSYAHRLLICGALANGSSIIDGVSESVDMEATLGCIRALGASYTKTGDRVSINGGINKENKKRILNCFESGSTLRFFIPIALLTGDECVLTGSERLMSRGLEVYEEIFERQGISFTREKNQITLNGTLKPDVFNVRGDISSQFISGLLFALPLLDGDSTINITTKLESASYVDITIEALKLFGIEIQKNQSSFFIKGNQKYICSNRRVEGDYSNSAFLDAFNILGGDVDVLGLNEGSIQGDKIYKEYFKLLSSGTPTLDISNCPDLGPVLFALAALKNGATFTGTKRLKIKESDRTEAMKTELNKLGVCLDVQENSVTVHSGACAPNETLFGHNDHRIVMALSIALTLFGGEIDGCEAVSKSYPDFFEVMAKLGIRVEVVK